MKFQSLISRVSVVLFAAALTLTSCTKNENFAAASVSDDLTQDFLSIEEAVIGSWSVQSSSSISVVLFELETGTSDEEGEFSMELDGTEYTEFSWNIEPSELNEDNYTVQVSYGVGENMQRTFEVNSYSEDQISLSYRGESIMLNK